ncbi:MAG: hypothetical protein H6518_06425 [Microthrixaceae bacterium]|nr:hypothetical protein [Microthrixaceae bacterium]
MGDDRDRDPTVGPGPGTGDAPDDEASDEASDDDAQFGLGRGLGAILGPGVADRGAGPLPAPAGGLAALFGAAPGDRVAPRVDALDDPGARVNGPGLAPRTGSGRVPPPLPLLPRDGRRARRVHPAAAPLRAAVEAQLAAFVQAIDLDVAVHLRPGPGGGRLTVVRPGPGTLPADEMDELCRAVRSFVGERRLTTDDFAAAGHHCVAFGPRPLTSAGVYVLGRRDRGLTMDERWAVHQQLVPAARPA